MDVLLVNPRLNGRSEIPPHSLACVAAPLLGGGIDVAILDLDVGPPEEALKALHEILKGKRPRIVGVTALSDSFPSAADICRTVKCLNADTLTVMGGMHPTVSSVPILENHREVDLVVRGEGEHSMREVAECHLTGLDFSGIDGISFRMDGRIVRHRDRNMEKDLDGFPLPAHHLLDSSRYRTRSISSSRGCFHQCTFCSIQSQYHHRVRVRGTESILREIGDLVSLGAKRIMFTDDNFTFSAERLRDICKGIIRRGFHQETEFYAEGRIDDINREPLTAGILREAGFRALYMGAESGSSRILDYYRKGIEPADILTCVSSCVEQDLTPVVNFILLGPEDTVETVRETLGMAKKAFENGAEIAYAETLIPYPGTPIMASLVRDGKFREKEGAYYFESYEDIDLERFLKLCDLSRDLTNKFHSGTPCFEVRKAYFELDYLDQLLCGRFPEKPGDSGRSGMTGYDEIRKRARVLLNRSG